MSINHPLTSQRKAVAVSLSLFIVGILFLSINHMWWPGMILVFGLPLALKQYLTGRKYDTGLTLVLFLGLFITITFDITWKVVLPVLFGIGSFYMLLKEFVAPDAEPEEDKEEDLNKEIEEK
jgi:hypothetical protein